MIVGTVYLQKGSKTSGILIQFINSNIDKINKLCRLDLKYINPTITSQLKKIGVTSAPVLIIDGNVIQGVEKIIRRISPPSILKDRSDFGTDSWEEEFHQHCMKLIPSDSFNPDEDTEETNSEEDIKRKMIAMQKRRPRMIDVDRNHIIEGGRDIKFKSKSRDRNGFDSDESFLDEARFDNVETPTITDSENGDLILEEDRLRIAESEGKKSGVRRPIPRY